MTTVFRDAVAAEWMRLRTLRSTYAFLTGAAVVTLLGLLLLALLIRTFDAAPPAERANFETVDPTVVVVPFVMFLVGAVAAASVTGEFATGSIGPALLAVPQRPLLFGAKATVAAGCGLVGGLLSASLTVIGATLLLGGRPAPPHPWPVWTDAVATVAGATLTVTVAAVVALGLGALLRSTAATLVTLGGLVLVAPVVASFLPPVWRLRCGSVLLPNLTAQLTGADGPYLLPPAGAAGVLAGYVVVALVAGAFAFVRRDVG
ncbi:ABC transporter permease [Micromonospora maritima]|uniref:ABC transporter permease n=1 Tax=Micromonospora maritima TaxID=986711 RepID=A0ABW7ZR59_9ACTN